MADVEVVISEDELQDLIARRLRKSGIPGVSRFDVRVEVFRFGKWTRPQNGAGGSAPVRLHVRTTARIHEPE